MLDEQNDDLLRLAEVEKIVGFKSTWIYREVRAGRFPAPYKPGGWSTRWSSADINEWVRRVKLGLPWEP